MTLTERYFRALGWKTHEIDFGYGLQRCWEMLDGKQYPEETLPNITEHFPSFRQYVIEEMERRGWRLDITTYIFSDRKESERHVEWFHDVEIVVYEAPIKDNEILSAAIEAAYEYLKKEKEDE